MAGGFCRTPGVRSAPVRALSYARTSTDEQLAGLDAQDGVIRAAAAARGWVLVDVVRDAGVSGAELDRSGLTVVLEQLRQARGAARSRPVEPAALGHRLCPVPRSDAGGAGRGTDVVGVEAGEAGDLSEAVAAVDLRDGLLDRPPGSWMAQRPGLHRRGGRPAPRWGHWRRHDLDPTYSAGWPRRRSPVVPAPVERGPPGV